MRQKNETARGETLRRWGRRLLLGAMLLTAAGSGAQAGLLLDRDAIAEKNFGNDAPWYEDRIPFFETADRQIEDIYYYRWKVFRAHQRDLGARGFISTEFLDDVSWQLWPWASLNDATGFHIMEGRWLRDRRYVNDYINFMYTGGNDRHFSEAIPYAVWQKTLVDGDFAFAQALVPEMARIYDKWFDHYSQKFGLYWVEPLADATEYTISSIEASGGKDGFWGGQAFRPSINSYMYASAPPIANLAQRIYDQTGDESMRDTANEFRRRAKWMKGKTQELLWNKSFQHFTDRYYVNNKYVRYGDFIPGRELVGYVPWAYDLPDDDPKYAEAWAHILDSKRLGGAFGLRTVEPSYRSYMKQYRYDSATGLRECQWNGPSWPYQTTQVLQGMANLLDHYKNTGPVTRSDYMRLLKQYAAQHYRNGVPNLQEDYDPDKGDAIVGLPRSHHYNHSGYVDLVISGLVGLRPREDAMLEVNPLVPSDPAEPGFQRYFALEDVAYHGHLVSVIFDADGSRYPLGPGLHVLVDGIPVASSPTITRLTVPLDFQDAEPVDERINRAVALVPGQFPKPSASVNGDSESMRTVVDGRVWFFPEMANGWSTAGAENGMAWLELDLGKDVSLSGAELAFFGDDRQFAAPSSVQLQLWQEDRWVDVASDITAVENGVVPVDWAATTASKARVLIQNEPGKAARLVELKLF